MIPARNNQWYGYIPDLPDHRDYKFTARAVSQTPVDLRSKCPPVMNQGELGSCTAHGITGALRYVRKVEGFPDTNLARLQLYYDERKIEGTVTQDAGAMIRDGIKTAAKLGVGDEKLWPYDVSKFKKKPSAAVYKSASLDLAIEYQRVTITANAIKAALSAGYPVIIGISVYESFESPGAAKTGIIPLPTKTEQAIGGHCMYVVGFGQKHGYFTVRNSWDTDWGDKGDCYIPETYLGNSDLGSDYWIIKSTSK